MKVLICSIISLLITAKLTVGVYFVSFIMPSREQGKLTLWTVATQLPAERAIHRGHGSITDRGNRLFPSPGPRNGLCECATSPSPVGTTVSFSGSTAGND